MSLGRTKSRYTSVILLITHFTCLERARVRVRVQTVLRILAYPKWPLRSPWRSSTRRARCALGTCRVVTGCDGACARNRREITRGRSNASHSITELRPPLTDDLVTPHARRRMRPRRTASLCTRKTQPCAFRLPTWVSAISYTSPSHRTRSSPAPSDSTRGKGSSSRCHRAT